MEWRRAWDWAVAVVFDVETQTLEFRSGVFGVETVRSVNQPAEESRTRFPFVPEYWSSYR